MPINSIIAAFSQAFGFYEQDGSITGKPLPIKGSVEGAGANGGFTATLKIDKKALVDAILQNIGNTRDELRFSFNVLEGGGDTPINISSDATEPVLIVSIEGALR